jgi:antitoxin (DNA-binding transcriptional repressor) of toxin-antitoxin stability system
MPTYTVHKAKTYLSKLIAAAEAGEEVVISRGEAAAVRLVPVGEPMPKRVFGALAGKIKIGPAFSEPLPPAELDAWEQ